MTIAESHSLFINLAKEVIEVLIRETTEFEKDRTGKVGIEKNFIKIEAGKKE